MLDTLHWYNGFTLHFALQYLCSLNPPVPAGRVLWAGGSRWADNHLIRSLYAEYLDWASRSEAPLGFDGALDTAGELTIDQAAALLERIDHPAVSVQLEEIAQWRSQHVNWDFLRSVGRRLVDDDSQHLRFEHGALEPLLNRAQSLLMQAVPRGLVICTDAQALDEALHLSQQPIQWPAARSVGRATGGGPRCISRLSERAGDRSVRRGGCRG